MVYNVTNYKNKKVYELKDKSYMKIYRGEFMPDKRIFISHSSADEKIADMLLDFLAAMGISKTFAFCSSLPGNDVRQKIPKEIKEAIQNSGLNIVILSNECYQSVYCLNEQGIIWFHDTPVIVIAMPEIQPDSMIGFLDNEYKIRRLDNDDDIIAVYDQIAELFSVSIKSVASLTYEIKKLKQRYNTYIADRKTTEKIVHKSEEINLIDILTNDEKFVLYYLLLSKGRKITRFNIDIWITQNELYYINIDNAFDLLCASGWGTLINGENISIFELEISKFRELTKDINFARLEAYVVQYYNDGINQFIKMWDSNQFDESDLLFIAYIIERNITFLKGDGAAKEQISSIKRWESKYSLKETLSKNYNQCLAKFVENNLIYKIPGDSYSYYLHKSLRVYLMKDFPYKDTLESLKKKLTS